MGWNMQKFIFFVFFHYNMSKSMCACWRKLEIEKKLYIIQKYKKKKTREYINDFVVVLCEVDSLLCFLFYLGNTIYTAKLTPPKDDIFTDLYCRNTRKRDTLLPPYSICTENSNKKQRNIHLQQYIPLVLEKHSRLVLSFFHGDYTFL